MLLSKRKKAIMGIGTLIIFIATILVAAVAAGVLISTSGVLQQRALITGQEARKKITNAIEVISIVGYGNKTDESMNDFEVLVRLDAGSDPTQMKNFDISFIGPHQHAGAKLAHPVLLEARLDPDTFNFNVTGSAGIIDNETQTSIQDLDGDGRSERLYLFTPANTSQDDYLVINFSSSDAGAFMYNMGNIQDLSFNESREFDNHDILIAGDDGEFYGYIQMYVNMTQNATLDVSSDDYYIAITKYYTTECEFDTVPPEDYYCFEVMHGDNDEVLGDGEVFMLKFRLKEDNKLYIGEEFQFIFSSEKGRLTRAQARTPDIIQTLRVPLWPVG